MRAGDERLYAYAAYERISSISISVLLLETGSMVLDGGGCRKGNFWQRQC